MSLFCYYICSNKINTLYMSHTVTIKVALRSASALSQVISDIALDLGVIIVMDHSMKYDVYAHEESYDRVYDLICDVECALLEYDCINIEDIEVSE
jgi:hypothetical protein